MKTRIILITAVIAALACLASCAESGATITASGTDAAKTTASVTATVTSSPETDEPTAEPTFPKYDHEYTRLFVEYLDYKIKSPTGTPTETVTNDDGSVTEYYAADGQRDSFTYADGVLAYAEHSETADGIILSIGFGRLRDGTVNLASFGYDDQNGTYVAGEAGYDGVRRIYATLRTMIHDGYKILYSERYHADGSIDTMEAEYNATGAVMSESVRWYDMDGNLIEYTVTDYIYEDEVPNEQSKVKDKNKKYIFPAK